MLKHALGRLMKLKPPDALHAIHVASSIYHLHDRCLTWMSFERPMHFERCKQFTPSFCAGFNSPNSNIPFPGIYKKTLYNYDQLRWMSIYIVFLKMFKVLYIFIYWWISNDNEGMRYIKKKKKWVGMNELFLFDGVVYYVVFIMLDDIYILF